MRNDLTGQRFGRLTAIRSVESIRRHAAWLCACDCGKETVVTSDNLRPRKGRAPTTSCGCFSRDKFDELKRRKGFAGTGTDEVIINLVYSTYSRRAIRDDLEFTLTKQDFANRIFDPCFYCGAEPYRRVAHGYVSGLDRVDAEVGYVPGNVVPCCYTCNRVKQRQSVEKFVDSYEPARAYYASLEQRAA